MMKLAFAQPGLDPEVVQAAINEAEQQSLPLWIQTYLVFPDFPFFTKIAQHAFFYAEWVVNFVQGDWGYSSYDYQAITTKLTQALPVTLGMNLVSLLGLYSLSLFLGYCAARRPSSWMTTIWEMALLFLYAMPSFWLAMILLQWFALGDGIFPVTGLQTMGSDLWTPMTQMMDRMWHLVLPVSVQILGGLAFGTRFARHTFIQLEKEDFWRTALAKGLPLGYVFRHHGLRISALSFISLLGTVLPQMLSGSIFLEAIFGLPGMGKLALEAVLTRDYPLVMTLTALTASLTLVNLIIVDALYGLVDPRLRRLVRPS
jgi:peptide/nickel transport system permease protein